MSENVSRSAFGAIRKVTGDIATDVFAALLALYCFLLIGEGIKPGFVNYFFALDIFSAAVFLAGAAAVLAVRAPGRGAFSDPGQHERASGPGRSGERG